MEPPPAGDTNPATLTYIFTDFGKSNTQNVMKLDTQMRGDVSYEGCLINSRPNIENHSTMKFFYLSWTQ